MAQTAPFGRGSVAACSGLPSRDRRERLAVSPVVLVLAALLAGPAWPQSRILVQGHRGARAVLPENTLPAFEYAISAGADVIELDLAVTRDNVAVVSHDPILPEAICSGPEGDRAIRRMTLAELRRWDCGSRPNPAYPAQKPSPGARVPTLDEVLALAPRGEFHFNIETKLDAARPELAPAPEEFARLVLDAIKPRRLESRVIVQSFDFRTLRAMKQLDPQIRLAALLGHDRLGFVEAARDAGAEIISPEFRLVTREKVEAAHKAGLKVVPWTPNAAADWDRLIDAGVDAIITDDPAALIAHLKKRGLR